MYPRSHWLLFRHWIYRRLPLKSVKIRSWTALFWVSAWIAEFSCTAGRMKELEDGLHKRERLGNWAWQYKNNLYYA